MIAVAKLSARELQIIDLVAEDMSDKEIAEVLGVSKATVSAHLSNIAEKLVLRATGLPRRRGIRRWLEGRSVE
jgi:DNA-binding CsgD family transcriptional regulator